MKTPVWQTYLCVYVIHYDDSGEIGEQNLEEMIEVGSETLNEKDASAELERIEKILGHEVHPRQTWAMVPINPEDK